LLRVNTALPWCPIVNLLLLLLLRFCFSLLACALEGLERLIGAEQTVPPHKVRGVIA